MSTVLDTLHIKPPTGTAPKGQALARDGIFTYFPHTPAVPDWLLPAVCIHSGDWKLIRLFNNGDTNAVVPTPNPKFDPAQYRPELIGVQFAKEKADH